jgi:hypothetical protein
MDAIAVLARDSASVLGGHASQHRLRLALVVKVVRGLDGRSVREIARELDVHRNTAGEYGVAINRWLSELHRRAEHHSITSRRAWSSWAWSRRQGGFRPARRHDAARCWQSQLRAAVFEISDRHRRETKDRARHGGLLGGEGLLVVLPSRLQPDHPR